MIDADDSFDVQSPAGHGARLRRLLWRAGPSTIAIASLVAIATHRYLPGANADALLPALMSTQHWTLFYWGQDRLANLVPLLAMPIRDPDWNFRTQTILISSAFFAVGAAFVSHHAWSRGLHPRPVEHATATFATGLLVIAPFQELAGYRFVVEQLYFVTVLLFIGALYCWTHKRWYVPAACLALGALLVNPSLLLAAPFVWLVDVEPNRRIRRSVGFVATVVTGFVLTSVASRLFATGGDVDEGYDDFAADRIASGLRLATRRIVDSVDPPTVMVILVAAVVIVSVSASRLTLRARLLHLALPAFGAVWLVTFGSNRWVASNAHDFRYFYPIYVWYMFVVASASAEIVHGVACRLGHAGRVVDRTPGTRGATASLGLAVIVALVLSVVVTRGVRVLSLETGRDVIDRAGVTDVSVVIGDYWTVWPIVVAGRADGIELLGVSHRSEPIASEIRRFLDRQVTAGREVGAICSGVDADGCARQLGGIDGRAWTVSEVVRDEPLVVRLAVTEVD